MLNGTLIHPEILAALGRAGHGSRVLISDGNYPHHTTRGPNAQVVYLNLSPGIVGAADALCAVAAAIPVESAAVMETLKVGPYAMRDEPPIWEEFRGILAAAGSPVALEQIPRFDFYESARDPSVCLVIATAEQRIYANILLTIGVRREAGDS